MLQLDNQTPYQAERSVLLDLDGSEIWVVAVKATFEIKNGAPVLADEQEPVCLADEFVGEPGVSSMKYENELVFRKPGTDVVVNGHAYAPNGHAVARLDAAVRVGPVQKVVRVYGDRIWLESVVGLEKSSPQPFVKMPLLYERAYGGTDLSDDDPKKHAAEDRNPVGRGFGTSRSTVLNAPLPNLEDPTDELDHWKSRPRPAGFGLVCKHWLPRRQYAGTYDDAWTAERMPLLPLDFDPRFFLGAPDGLVATPHLRGGEPVYLRHLTPGGNLSFTLPNPALSFRTRIAGAWIPHGAKLGSVILEPDVPRVLMVWQTMVPCHRKKLAVETTEITEKERAAWT